MHYSDMHPRECNSKRSTYHQWCALPTRRALVTHSPYTLPRCMLLDLPRGMIRTARWQRGWLQTSCPHSTNWNCDLDSQYLPYLWLVLCSWCTGWATRPIPLHPSTRGLSPKDLCFPFFFRRLEHCVCFSGPGKQ